MIVADDVRRRCQILLTSTTQLIADANLTEEEVVLQNAISENPDGEQKAALVLKLREGMSSLSRVLKTIEKYQVSTYIREPDFVSTTISK